MNKETKIDSYRPSYQQVKGSETGETNGEEELQDLLSFCREYIKPKYISEHGSDYPFIEKALVARFNQIREENHKAMLEMVERLEGEKTKIDSYRPSYQQVVSGS